MAKVEKESAGNWGKFGGSQHMHTFQGAGEQRPGGTAVDHGGNDGRREQKIKAGPSDVMGYSRGTKGSSVSNKDYAGTQEAGTSGPTKKGGDEKFACGGSAHMWGNRGSQKAVSGQSGPNG
jgi:hypothetical protein